MRTLGEIVHDARRGKVPTADEMRYALCAMDALITFDRMAFMKLAQAEKEGKKPFLTYSGAWQWEEHFGRVARALAKSPKDWLGPDNDPDSADVQRRRAATEEIFRAVSKRLRPGAAGANEYPPKGRSQL